jgi:2-dehydropantoate 2-reductase
MNVAVIGCGAIGGVLAANLARAGVRVTPITGNPSIALALTERGFRVREMDGTEWAQAPTATPLVHATDGDDRRPFDLVFCAVQSTRLESALESIKPRLAKDALVVVCQNGLPEDRAARVLGPGRAIGCVVVWAASMIEPGLYVRTSVGYSALGRFDGGASHERLAEAARVLEAAAPVKLPENYVGTRWSKLAINCVTTTIGAAGGGSLGALMKYRVARRLAMEVFSEVAAVARAEGVRPEKVGGVNLQRVSLTDEERATRIGSPSLLLKHGLLLAVGIKYRRLRSSMLYALERGRPPEVDFLNGEVVRRGDALGVPVPVNRALVEKIREIAAGKAKPGLANLNELHAKLVAGELSMAAPEVLHDPALQARRVRH